MKLLLDTHIFLWSLLEPQRLTPRVASELQHPANELWVSSITTWEVLVLAEKGRIRLDPDPVTWIRKVYAAVPFQEASLTHEIAIHSRMIRLPHQDPGDRFLVATAKVHGMTLVTADDRLLRTPACPVLPNREI
ncbi:twitching motility protein PilT [Candidatus Methylomirabilis lanthanidiphila]|uniref:Twitching motility protein PilT n=1 Tax=Candidatus Methylomirabilis lanthanidiphila TaxID=2211376 RepID=A0A564ZI28_9BACT|nr:type II toxin-antitoxin system VapC family toxin [Candidatus Methylomirabilis lanthanidiphila]VUZ84813.1 twitching motility protein PilT [Candidatus Methylomirabilis lanthanidiphila]